MQKKHIHSFIIFFTLTVVICLMACSPTGNLGEDEQLYTGMKKTVYENYVSNQHFIDTQTEVEAALACPPNGAFLGSSYVRTIPYALWVYNAFNDKKGSVSKWITQTLGKAPVLITDVEPEVHVSVAENVLQNNGYFRGKINYKIVDGKVGKTKTDSVPRVLTAKVAYTVNFGPLYTLDSIEYKGFSDKEMALIKSTPTLLHRNDAFSISTLDEERTRIYDVFKDNGYYYFEKSYITYMADTLQVPQHVQLQICKLDSLPEDAEKQWKLGKTTFRIRRQMMEKTPDTLNYKILSIVSAGKPAVRPSTVLQSMQLRPKKLISEADLEESQSRLTTTGIFSTTDISFKKVDDTFNTDSTYSTDSIGTLDMTIDCVLDKPYDFSLSANYTQKASGRSGPGVGMGFAKRNAFHRGEILSLDLNASVEYQIGNKVQDRNLNYDIGTDISLQVPRLLLPKFLRKHRHWFIPPSTMFTLGYNRVNRSGYFRKNIFSAEFSYILKPTQKSTHTITPLAISHTRLAYHSASYDSLMSKSGVGIASLEEYFTPKIRYTFNYSTKSLQVNPIVFSATIAEAGNITTGLLKLFGQDPSRTAIYTIKDYDVSIEHHYKEYRMFNTPVSQNIRFEVDFVKTWRMSAHSSLAAHFFGGYLRTLSSENTPPFAECYYTGGANDLRGFSTRGVGPGNFHSDISNISYYLTNGDLKLTFNLEYRPRIFGSLYGALFIDAGNIWASYYNDTSDDTEYKMQFRLKNLPKDLAVDAGAGVRYDLGFFVIRLDWGFIVHAPYDTGRSGYFNFPSFKKGQCLNFAIGYPF